MMADEQIQVNSYAYAADEDLNLQVDDLVEISVSPAWQHLLGKTQTGYVSSLDPGDYEGPLQRVLRVIARADEEESEDAEVS